MNTTSIKAFMLSAALAVTAGTASAVTMTYVDIDRPDKEIAQGKSYSGNFNIVTGDGDVNIVISGYTSGNGTFSDIAGYPANGTLTSATAYFYLKDANQGQDMWEIELNMKDFLEGSGTLSGQKYYTQFGTVGGAQFDFLNNNGHISYTVSNISDNPGNGAKFTLEFARLVATAETRTSVPDGGATLALLGLSTMGMAAIRRKVAI